MLLKYGVNPVISWPLARLFPAFDRIFRATAKREAIITSANDGHHSSRSLHHKRKKGARAGHPLYKMAGAIDFRTRDMTSANIEITAGRLRELSRQNAPEGKESLFDVVVENNHIHIEIDPK